MDKIEGLNTSAIRYDKETEEVYVGVRLIEDLGTHFKLTGNQISVFMTIMSHLFWLENNAIKLVEIAESTNLNISTVRTCIAKLEEKELIVKWIPEGSNDRTYHYDFAPHFYYLLGEVY